MDTTLIWGMVLFSSFISIFIWSHVLLNTPILQAEWIEESTQSQVEFSTNSLNAYETSGSMG